MKDLDFDELDKAVNSIMATANNAPKTETPAPLGPTPPSVTTPAAVTTKQKETATPAAASAPVLPKRGGRFMDVVHPSSDMTGEPRSTVRQGTSLKPLNDNVIPEPTPEPTKTTAPAAPLDLGLSTTQETAPVKKASEPSKEEWPDPLDLHDAEKTSKVTEEASSVQDITTSTLPDPLERSNTVDTSADNSQASGTEQERAASPFLTDTKVEKRPLGAASTGTDSLQSSNNPMTTVGDDTTNSEKTLDKDAQVIPKVQLPEELGSDLLAVESDIKLTDQKPTQEAVSPVVSDQAAETVSGPVSIAQQYKTQPSTRDVSHAAVYDTSAEPLAHPAKKKSGWLGVVITILILILFGAGGAAVYFFDLIPL